MRIAQVRQGGGTTDTGGLMWRFLSPGKGRQCDTKNDSLQLSARVTLSHHYLLIHQTPVLEATPALKAILTKRRVSSADAFEHVHREFSIIFRVASSDSVIDVERLETRLRDLYLFIVQNFKWARISETVHHVLAHTAEQIRLNDNTGLCTLGEQGSESKINSN